MNTDTAESLATLGIQAAVDHAEDEAPGWNAMSAKLFEMYGAMHPEGFLTEDVRNWAAKLGFEAPPDERAWGGVARTLSASGIIKSMGVSKQRNPSGHGGFRTVWQLVRS